MMHANSNPTVVAEDKFKVFEEIQRATLNILEDFDAERRRLEQGQRATLNILEDFNGEKARMELSQRALLNILEDFEGEKTKVEEAKQQLELNEAALQTKNIELERAIRAKDRFLASMSHELRTPLNAIIGFTGTLLMKLSGPINVEQERQLRTVQASSRHLLSLINDLLDLAKIDSGKVELKLEMVPCGRVLTEVASTLEPLAVSKGLKFEYEFPEEELLLRTDHRSLRQILINLTNNAIKFTEHGWVRLRVERLQRDGTVLTQFTVSDSGIGIGPEDQLKLFQAFSRVGEQSNRREGTGLGLHLSQKIAGLLGGTIAVESAAGQGSSFFLRLKGKSD